MEANGWVFSWDNPEKDFWPSNIDYYCADVSKTSYCGYCFSSCIGKLSLIIELSGYKQGWLEISYGNSWNSDTTVQVYFNGRLSSSIEHAHTFGKFNTTFNDGDVLMVQEIGGVMVINEIHFQCSEIEDSSLSPSVPPIPYPSGESVSSFTWTFESIGILIIIVCLVCLVCLMIKLVLTFRENVQVKATISTHPGL